jgi:hypothetical protein
VFAPTRFKSFKRNSQNKFDTVAVSAEVRYFPLKIYRWLMLSAVGSSCYGELW